MNRSIVRRCTTGILLVLGLGVVGCDKLPWPFNTIKSTASIHPVTASATTTPTAVTPSKPSVLPADILAMVNGVPISKADVEMRIKELKALTTSLRQPWKSLTPEQIEAVLKELINTELMSQEAVARGLDRSTEAQRKWEFVRRGFFAQEWLGWNRDRQEISQADVEKYYEQNKLGFREPERRRLRQLTIASEDQAKQALAKLLGESMDFAALAQQISVGATAKDGGMIADWVMRGNEKAYRYRTEEDAKAAGIMSLDPVLEAAAFAIDHDNGLSNYVKGPDNRYHIFQLVKHEVGRQLPLNEVQDTIKTYLTIQKLQQSMEALTTQAKIEKFSERLSRVEQ